MSWKLFEKNATSYINEVLSETDYYAENLGGSNSNEPDIKIFNNNQTIIHIECKYKISQAAQFVVLKDSGKFIDSSKNKGNPSRRKDIIKHMNELKEYYSKGNSIDLVCSHKIMVDAIKKHFIDKGVKYIIASNHHEDFKNNLIKIIQLNDIDKHFIITGKYRIKRSGTRHATIRDLNSLKKLAEETMPEPNVIEKDKRLYITLNQPLKSKYIGSTFFLTEVGKNTYAVRKRSQTQNRNIIFTMKFNPTAMTSGEENFVKEITKRSYQ